MYPGIERNYEYLKSQNINIKDVESCLHVLSSEEDQLRDTFTYVKENYGVKSLESITSILAVDREIIRSIEDLNIKFKNKNGNLSVAVGIAFGTTTIENIQAILRSQEYKDHPELFTSTTLAQSNIERIQAILRSQEYKDHPELFTSQTLAHSNIEKIQLILRSQEYKDHPELFTSQTLAHSNIERIQAILRSQEYKDHPELFTSTTLADSNIERIQAILRSQEYRDHPELFTSETLARSNIERIQAILRSQEYKDHPELFTSQTLAHSNIERIQAILRSQEYRDHPELFTSTTLARSNIEDISKLLKLDYWKDERYKKLLTSTILSKSKSMLKKLPILFKMAEHFHIDDKLTTSFLLFSPSQNYALIKLLEEKNEPLIVNRNLNYKFGRQPGVLLKQYGIDIKESIKKYPFDESIFDKKDGLGDCIDDDKTKKSDISNLSGVITEIGETGINNLGIGDV